LAAALEGLINDDAVAEELMYALDLTGLTVPAVIKAIRDLALGAVADADPQEAAFVVSVNGEGSLQEFSISYDAASVSLELVDQNSVKPDEAALQELQDEAIDIGELLRYEYGGY
jgi:hypothetical protein